jgi:DNA-directed RNA polymerase specialized sigma24 family protein
VYDGKPVFLQSALSKSPFATLVMTSEGSVSRWIDPLKGGDAAAAQQLWERYFDRLVRLARRRLQSAAPRAADEEDVALSAFASFCRGALAGRFPKLGDRDDLWKILVVITARKASHLVRDEGRQKRRGGRVSLDAGMGSRALLELVLSREPTPEFATEVAEQYQRLLARLSDPELIRVANLKMEGYTNDEIATQQNYTTRTVERKLRIIRGIWEKDNTP